MFILGRFEDNTISVSALKLNKCMSVDYTAACSWSSGALRKASEEAFILNGLRRTNFPIVKCTLSENRHHPQLHNSFVARWVNKDVLW